jgi:hypothetical protein
MAIQEIANSVACGRATIRFARLLFRLHTKLPTPSLQRKMEVLEASTLSIWRSRNTFIHSELRTADRGTRGHLGPN